MTRAERSRTAPTHINNTVFVSDCLMNNFDLHGTTFELQEENPWILLIGVGKCWNYIGNLKTDPGQRGQSVQINSFGSFNSFISNFISSLINLYGPEKDRLLLKSLTYTQDDDDDYVCNLSTFTTDTSCQLNVLWHNGDTLGVDRAQVRVFE